MNKKDKYGNELYLTRGDTHFFQFRLENPDGSPAELMEGDTMYFTAKKTVHDEEPAFQIKVDSFEDGLAKFTVEPEDTKDLMFGNYVYDVQVTFKGGVIKTVIKPSRLIIGEEVTYD